MAPICGQWTQLSSVLTSVVMSPFSYFGLKRILCDFQIGHLLEIGRTLTRYYLDSSFSFLIED
jgi:hypothetical protein